MIISKKTKGELLGMLEELGAESFVGAAFVEKHQGKLTPTEAAFSEMSLHELKVIKSIVQFAIHEKEGVAA